MIFRKKVRAGTLLYALLMLGIFSLLLQFYLQSQVAIAHGTVARKEEGQAYLMAVLTRDEVLSAKGSEDKEISRNFLSGEVDFTAGKSHYSRTKEEIQVKVTMDSGKAYTYRFLTLKGKDKQ